jgi:enoyl-CoA hydratase/carnithine racemase
MLSTERHDNVTVITLRHGKVHVLDLELAEALTAAVRDVAPGDPVVLTGTGRAFSAGVDLKRIVDGGAPTPGSSTPGSRSCSSPSSTTPARSSPRSTGTRWRAAASSPPPATTG